MAKKEPAGEQLRSGERVVAAVSLPQIPEGTGGKVVFVEGFSWIRYWVRFENGVTRGSLHRRKLARPAEYRDLLARRERGEEEPDKDEAAVAASPNGSSGSDEGGGDAAATGAAGRVPAHLLERSKQRREALGK